MNEMSVRNISHGSKVDLDASRSYWLNLQVPTAAIPKTEYSLRRSD